MGWGQHRPRGRSPGIWSGGKVQAGGFLPRQVVSACGQQPPLQPSKSSMRGTEIKALPHPSPSPPLGCLRMFWAEARAEAASGGQRTVWVGAASPKALLVHLVAAAPTSPGVLAGGGRGKGLSR